MKLLYFFICLAFSVGVCGQTRLHQFHQLNKENGLAAGTNNNFIFADSRNNVWISSIAGLHRFDGHRIKQYHQGVNPGDLISEIASASHFSEDERGRIWFTLGKAFSFYDYVEDRFSHFKVKLNQETVSSNYSWSWLDSRDGNFYFGAGRNLYVVNTNSPKDYHLLDSVRVNFKAKMVPLENGGVRLLRILPDSEEISCVDFVNGKRYLEPTTFFLPQEATLNDALAISDNELFVATSKGLYSLSLSDANWTAYSGPKEDLSASQIELERLGDTLYIGTKQSGIHLFSLTERGFLGPIMRVGEQGVEQFKPSLVRLYLSPNRTLWISTDGQGVFYTDLKASKVNTLYFSEKVGLGVIDVMIDHRGNVVALYYDHYLVNQSGVVTDYPIPTDKTSEFGEPTFIDLDRNGRLFIGTYDRLFVADSLGGVLKSIHLIPNAPYRMGYGYNSMEQLPGGELVFCVNDSVPIIVQEDLTLAETYLPEISRARKIVRDGTGTGIVLTYVDTLHVFSESDLRTDTFFINQPLVIDAVYDSLNEVFWLGTLNGLYRLYFLKGAWTLRREAVIGDGAIMSVILGLENDLWMAGSEGLRSYNVNTGNLDEYLLSDGIQGAEFRLDSRAISKNGTLYFGGGNGLTYFNPAEVYPTVAEPRLRVVNFLVNDNKINASKLLQLEHDENNITFELANGDLSDPSENKYFYTLEGSSRPDMILLPEATLSFTNLSFGQYLLKLWSANSDGVRQKEPLVFPITILPPWYRTWWAYTLYILLSLGALSAYFWQVLNKEREKSARARAEVQVAETETSILRLQMNPHFIFNSLNSIDEYIMIEEDVMRAHDYLVMFAELMRKILDMSEEPLTRLDREVEMIRGYVEAERMRVGEQLRFRVEQDEEVDMIFTWIPTMILQPFVENAIWHGIGDREQGGTVTLRFALQEVDQLVRVEVEDDGRGRGNAAGRTKEHTSKALEITRKRMELLNNKTLLAHQASKAPAAAPPNAHFEIEDLKKTDGTAAGTRVVLYLPLIYPDYDTSSSD